MGRPQEVQLDDALDVHAPPAMDEAETTIESVSRKDTADAAADISMPLALGNGGSKDHASAGPADVVATENGDHSSELKEKVQEEPAGPNYEKTEAEMADRKKQRMYFVREPSQAQSSDKLDAEIVSLIEKATKHRDQLDKLDIAFNEAREKRDAARAEHNPAREKFLSCKALYDEKMEELKPYNEASKAQRAEKTNFDSRWADLDFKNEQQLDEAIASTDYRMNHETNSVASEKKLIAELKKLNQEEAHGELRKLIVGPSSLNLVMHQATSNFPALYHVDSSVADEKKLIAELTKLGDQRVRVREYAQAKAEREGKQADEGQAAYSKAELDAMWAEVNTLKAERDTLKGIMDSLKQPLEEHTAAADELWKKRGDKRKEVDELNSEIREKKKERNQNSKAFSENRRLSQSVREMIRAKKVEEARRACEEQTDKAMGRLLGQPAEWKEYTRLWNEQRGHSIWENEDYNKRQSAAKAASSSNRKDDAAKAARIAAAYAADKAAALKAAEERIPEMRRREEEKAKARRADRGLPPRREQPSAEAPAALLSNGDGPHADAGAADASEDKEAVGGSVPALQSLHLGAEQMQDLMPAGKPAAKKSSKAKADVRPAVFLPPELDNDEPFVPPLAALKRDDTAASEEDEKEKARLRQAEAAREAEARKERKRRANERKAAQKAAASKAREVQKSAAAAAAAAVTAPEAMADEPDADAEQPSAADAAVAVNASEAAAPAAKTEAADKPASKAPARSARVAAPAAKIRLGSKKKGWKAHLEKFQRSALQFLSSRSGIALLAFLAVMVLLGVYGNRPQGVRV